MQAIMLAAGKGSRLGKYTKNICLIYMVKLY